MSWVSIPGGRFRMGSAAGDDDEKPPRQVTLGTFQITRTEITVAQYRSCVRAGACTAPHWDDGLCRIHTGGKWNKGKLPEKFRGDDHPMVCAAARQAWAFCRWAGGRLPTEAQWEFAARGGGQTRRYPWGDAPATCKRVVMKDRSAGCGSGSTLPVCSRPAGNTSHGVCDMAGNVWEWVEDHWKDSYEGAAVDGRAHREGDPAAHRVLRGGSWFSGASTLRAANRYHQSPMRFYALDGIRCVRLAPRK